ncbi:MAG TPA: type II toxin-antitoxin system VapB family antitoxin [Geobacterales bacterium]|jgi:antitoxin VapB|nr:type II toxin-antitoxin system VapB family antitoxin [Geobacterales bacterium]
MVPISKAKVFYSGRSQAVRIPAEFRFTTDEVYVRRDPQSGDLILSESPVKTWAEVFKALDDAKFPDDFLEDRDQRPPQKRDNL